MDSDSGAPEALSESIAAGHGYDHVEDGEFKSDPVYGSETGVETREDYQSHIYDTMYSSDTEAFTTQHGHDNYYQESSNTFIAHDPHRGPDHGTCFRPDEGRSYFERQFDRDLAHGGDPDRDRIVKGGYPALEDWKETQAEQSQGDASANDGQHQNESTDQSQSLSQTQEAQTADKETPQRSARLQRALDLANSRGNERDEGAER